jgi:hypothetical protein
VSLCPAWADNQRSFVWFRDAVSGSLIQRKQKSSNCFLHAPIIAYHYQLRRHDPSSPAIDIRQFIVRSLPPVLLSKLICGVGGGWSRDIFNMLLQPPAQTFVVSTVQEIRDSLRTCGPGLVCNFRVEREFRSNKHKLSFCGAFTSALEGLHSMVVVGFREDASGHCTHLLLQNWWRKQFVEVDEAYLQAADATVVFTRKQVVSNPSFTLPTTDIWAEAKYDRDDLQPDEIHPEDFYIPYQGENLE